MIKESPYDAIEENKKGEQVFIIFFSFVLIIILVRTWLFFGAPQASYPTVNFIGMKFYHSVLGAFLMLIGLSAFIKNRRVGPIALLAIGFGIGLFSDEAWSIFLRHESYRDYWNAWNLLPIFFTGAVLALLVNKTKKSHDFRIQTKEIKHPNPVNPRISVVIPAYNEEKFIETVLQSLVNQSCQDFELIVVDNNSSDNTSGVAQKYGAKVIYEKTKGVAAARQAGFFASRGEIVATTDADSVVPPNWLDKISLAFEKDKSLVGFGGLGILYSGPVTARAAGRYLFSYFWIIDRVFSGGWNLVGFNMAVQKKAFVKIGGFRVDLMLGEDVDLAKRLRAVGEVKVDTDFFVFISGRRYRNGLFAGAFVYAPSWIMRVVFKKEEFLKFPAVRSEKLAPSKLGELPMIIITAFIIYLFYLSNSR